MSTSIAIASMASAQAAAANARAEQAKTIACEGFVRGYQHESATVDQAKQYSECIDRLYPEEMDKSSVMWLKASIIVAVVFMVVASIKPPFTYGRPELFDRVMGGFLGLCCGALAPLLLWAFWLAAKFVVTA